MNSNKQLIQDLYIKVFGQGDENFANSVIADNYIQHNPMVKTGKAGFMEFLGMLKQIPKPENPPKPFKRVIADRDIVAIHSKIEFMGNENATVELYRIENGMIAEHWDAVQVIVDLKPAVVGTVELDMNESTSNNKNIVEKFVDHVYVRQQQKDISKFISDNLTLNDFETGFETFMLHRVIGENNFVLTQAEFKLKGDSYVIYDIYRLSKGFIIEHWAVKQKIPVQMAHSNGMI